MRLVHAIGLCLIAVLALPDGAPVQSSLFTPNTRYTGYSRSQGLADPWFTPGGARDSVERLVEDSDLIIQARVLMAVPFFQQRDGSRPEFLIVQVLKPLKGTAEGVIAVYAADARRCSFGSRQLLFLKDNAGGLAPWRLRLDAGGWGDAFPIGAPDYDFIAFTFDVAGQPIQGGGALSMAVEQEVGHGRSNGDGPTLVVYRPRDERSPMTSWFRTVIPLDERAERLAARRITSPDAALRLNAARVFLGRPTPDNVERVRPLLRDPFEYHDGYGKGHLRVYGIRLEVYQRLTGLGVSVAKPLIIEPNDSYSRPGAVLLLLAFGVPAAVAFACRVLTRRKDEPDAPWRWAACGGASALSLSLAATVTAFWVRSYYVVDQYAAGANPRWEFCFARGTLRVTQLPAWTGAAPRGFARFEVGTDTDELWATSADNDAAPVRSVLGFGVVRGSYNVWSPAVGGGGRLVYTQATAVGPLPVFVGAFLLFPTLRVLRLLVRRWRRRRRRLCLHCGYDLRAAPRNGTCPECGYDPRRYPDWRQRVIHREIAEHRAHTVLRIDNDHAAAQLTQVVSESEPAEVPELHADDHENWHGRIEEASHLESPRHAFQDSPS